MRETLFISFIISLLLFTACAPDSDSYKIGVSQCSNDKWSQYANEEILREAALYPDINTEFRIVSTDTEAQIEDIEYFIKQRVDVLIIYPNDKHKLIGVLDKAYEANIPVILVDGKVDSDKYAAHISVDNYQIGREAALYIHDLLNGKGNVVEVRGWGNISIETDRHSGFTDALKEFPDIRIIDEISGGFQQETAYLHMIDLIQKRQNDIDVVFSMNDEMALAIHNAYRKQHVERPYIIGVDALPGKGNGIDAVQNGLIDATFICPTGGDKAIQTAIELLAGKSVRKNIPLHTATVDRWNVKVIQTQNNLISEQQQKVDNINRTLGKTLTLYATQKTIFYGTVFILILILILLIVSILAYRSKNRSNKLLEKQKSQLIALSKQLEEATNAKLAFFTNISHEFKTPLTLILGPLEALLKNENLSKEQTFLLDLIKRNSNSLQHLISQIIEWRTYESGKMNISFVHDDMKYFLDELNIPFHDYSKRKQIQFSTYSDTDTLPMWFDKEKVEKIYFNLLSNAFKYSKSKITVSLNRENLQEVDYAKISVYNDGKAIPKEKLDSIFNYFYKVNPLDAGTGIGLAFTQALVEAHNGTITVDNDEEYGVAFNIFLPVKQEVPENTENEYTANYIVSQLNTLSPEASPALLIDNEIDDSKPIVLIVDDNTDMRNFMRAMLETEYTIIEAKNGNTGIEQAAKYIPDIIISDVMMPDKDGFEICRILKENINTNHIPIILLTACSLDEQKAVGFERGADAYIPKPFNVDLLKIRIRKLIENRLKLKETFSNSLIEEPKTQTLAETEQFFIDKFKDYIEENISNSDLNIMDITQHMGLSRAQLYRKIKALTGHSPTDLVRIIKLKYAAKIILSGTSISEAAYASGFSSPSYFTKSFKEYFKMNPSDYSKSNSLL